MKRQAQRYAGFTIVELLIVIVVIAILAAITVVAYNGIQERARNSKIDSDLATLDKAIQAARVTTGKPLREITGSDATAGACVVHPAGTDLAALDKEGDYCWINYLSALQSISDASEMDVSNIVDPWGRPYMIDENEQENVANNGACGLGQDYIAVFLLPHNGWGATNQRLIPYVTPGC